jgi:glutamine cyclotransferase
LIFLPVLFGAVLAIAVGFYLDRRARTTGTAVYGYRVVNIYPHDREAFTQGLAFEGGFLYEGTGLQGKSQLRKVNLETGEMMQVKNLAEEYFGEGITIFDGKVIQLTLQSGVGFIYDKESFEMLRQFSYSGLGWGLTHDGRRLIVSDGTPRLRFFDAETFEQTGQIEVRDGAIAVGGLNELEYVEGLIYANVWGRDTIVQIEPGSGKVVGWIDVSGLLQKEDFVTPVDVLNGIAYDAQNKRLFVTGKLWPKVFEIEVVGPRWVHQKIVAHYV